MNPAKPARNPVGSAAETGPIRRASEPPTKVVLEGPGVLVACVKDCLVALTPAPLTLEGVRAIEQAFSVLRAEHGRMYYFRLAPTSQPATSSKVSEEMARIVGTYTSSIIGAAVVCEEQGFRGTVVRSFITAVHMASRAKHPLQVFMDTRPALTWLASRIRTQKGLDVAELSRAIATLRARVEDLPAGSNRQERSPR